MNDSQTRLAEVARHGEALSVDGDTSLQALLDRPECHPLVCASLAGVASWQIRVETPVRRAIASPRVAPQWVAALLALGATVTLAADDGPRTLALAEMIENRTAGRVLALHIPAGGPGRRWGRACVARTPADAPIVLAVAVVETDDQTVRLARVALAGVWQEPVHLARATGSLVGGPLTAPRIRAVAAGVAQEVQPSGDYLGSVAYRRAMAQVLSRRALEQCLNGEGAEQ